MYILLPIFIVISLLFFIIFHFKKRCIIKKISCMTCCEKSELLNTLINPFGYLYEPCQDIFSTTKDAWQKHFGFTEKYNDMSPYFNMVFDSQTIYFNYGSKTWLIELWKGQYGINSGGEIGIYYADGIIPPNLLDKTLFKAVSDEDMLPFTLELVRYGKVIAMLGMRHWWLTIFDMGVFTRPKHLSINVSITFPDYEMLYSFAESLESCRKDISYRIERLTVFLTFNNSITHYSLWKHVVRGFSLFQDKTFCSLFNFITRPFDNSGDKILYLYYYLPFAFRRTLRLHRFKRKA